MTVAPHPAKGYNFFRFFLSNSTWNFTLMALCVSLRLLTLHEALSS
jgi:hypothetical protein